MKSSKLLVLLLCVSILPVAGMAQKIKPGKSIGLLNVGASQAEVKAIIGGADKVTNYEEQVSAFESSGYDIKQELPFFIGFDEVWEYDNSEQNNLKYPIFKIFFKDKIAVFIIVTSWGYSKDTYGGCKLKKGVKFFSTGDQVKKAFKAPEHKLSESAGESEWRYFSQGVNFAIDNDQMRALHLYKPLTATEKANFLKASE